jgi:hypothetical protein
MVWLHHSLVTRHFYSYDCGLFLILNEQISCKRKFIKLVMHNFIEKRVS